MTTVVPDSLWRHRNGVLYVVVDIANAKTEKPDEYPVTVVYRNAKTGSLWARKLSDWHRSFSLVGVHTEFRVEDVERTVVYKQQSGWAAPTEGIKATHIPTKLHVTVFDRTVFRSKVIALELLRQKHAELVASLQPWPEDVSEYAGAHVTAVLGGDGE